MKRDLTKNVIFWATAFALLNVTMYLTIHKFWIGGSSYLPLVGVLGPEDKFLFAFIVNIGVVLGAFISALVNGEFVLRIPAKDNLGKAVLGGLLIGIGFSLAPGTCTTAFVTGMPMLSVSSFLSVAGIFIGAYLAYKITWEK